MIGRKAAFLPGLFSYNKRVYPLVFNIEPHERKVFEVISRAAAELGYPVYVVGGYVRDRLLALLLPKTWTSFAWGAASAWLRMWRLLLIPSQGDRIQALWHSHAETPGYGIEFVGARKESYRSIPASRRWKRGA